MLAYGTMILKARVPKCWAKEHYDIEGTHGPQATKADNFSGHSAGTNDPRIMSGARMRPKPLQLMGHIAIIEDRSAIICVGDPQNTNMLLTRMHLGQQCKNRNVLVTHRTRLN